MKHKNHKNYLFLAFFASNLSVLKNLPCTLPQTYFEDNLMFFKSKSVENSFQTKDPTWLIVLGSLTLFATCIFCALDGASLSSSLSFGLVILLNVPIYVSMFKYEPDSEHSNEYYLCDSELYKLSGYEEVPILDKNSNYKFTEATRLIDRHIESQKAENRNREDYVPINLNKDDIAALTMVAAKNITNKLFIGYGYEFLPKHARRLVKLQEQGLKLLPNGKGSAQIHNLKRRHKPLFVDLQNIKDHAIIFGTTGSGKTRFFDLLITQAIERNDTVIIIDPKGDRDLKRRARRICACTHRDGAFHVLDIKDPKLTTSPFNLFGSSTSSSDIADKLSALMKQSTFDTDSFASYGQEAVACAVTALDCLDLPVDIYNICNHANIESYFEGMVAGLSKLTAKTQNRDLAVYFARLLKGYSIEKHLYTHVRDFLVSIGDEAQLDGIGDISEDCLLDPEIAFTLSPDDLANLRAKRMAAFSDANVSETDIVEAQVVETKTYEPDSMSSANSESESGSPNSTDTSTKTSKDTKESSVKDAQTNETETKPKRRGRPPKKKVEETLDSKATTEDKKGKETTKKTTAKKKTTKPKNFKTQVKAAAFITYYKYLKRHANLDVDPEFEKLVFMTIKEQSFFEKTTASIMAVLNTLNSYNLKQVLSKSPDQTDFSDIYQKNKVFYCALHSMSNATLSSYVGKLLLSDLSSFADHIYSMDEELHALDNHSSNDKLRHADDLFSKVGCAFNSADDFNGNGFNDNVFNDNTDNSTDHDLKQSDALFSKELYSDHTDPDAKAALELTRELVNLEEVNSFIEDKKAEKAQKALRYKARNPEFDKVMSILQAPKFDKVKQRRKVSIFIDEASEVVNEALLQLLNKARGADFSITIATQTFSDLAKRCGSKDAAMQLIGNCNTMYALRVKDEQTAEVITSSLPNTTFYTKNISTGTMSDTYKENYKDSASMSANTYIDRIFPASALMDLPNFEYVAKLSDGRFVKGVIQILTDNKVRA